MTQQHSITPSKSELFGLLMQSGGANRVVSIEWLEPFAQAILARWGLPAAEPEATITEPRGCPTPGACSCPTAPYVPPELIRALELAKAALADIGDADQANADIERKLQEAADEELDACCE